MDGSGVRLEGGVYRDHLVPGQTRYYRVPVDWGQRLYASASFAGATLTGSGGFTVNALQIAVYDPARGYVDGQSASYTGQAASVDAQTPPIAYDNRLSSDSRVNSSAVAGWYYLQVSLHPAVADYTTGGVEVTLRVALSGAAAAAPDYAGNAAAAGFGVTGLPPGSGSAGTSSRTAPEATAPSGGRGPSSLLPADPAERREVGYGAFVLAAVFTVWPTAWLLRSGRGRHRPAGH
jgi:hypothetical protein